MSDPGTSSQGEYRFYLCVTCGRLRREDMFEDGDCTCELCHEEGNTEVRWSEADDGDGFVATGGSDAC